MILDWTGPAQADLIGIRNYIELRDPRAAARMLERILACGRGLIDHPRRGRPGRRRGSRELVVPGLPYIIAYRVDATGRAVRVLRVLHGAQRWPANL